MRVALEVNDTELQMIYEGLKRVKPFAEMSYDRAHAEAELEDKISAKIDAMRSNADG